MIYESVKHKLSEQECIDINEAIAYTALYAYLCSHNTMTHNPICVELNNGYVINALSHVSEVTGMPGTEIVVTVKSVPFVAVSKPYRDMKLELFVWNDSTKYAEYEVTTVSTDEHDDLLKDLRNRVMTVFEHPDTVQC